MGALKAYAPRDNKYVEEKIQREKTFTKTFTKGEKKLLKGLKMEYFHFIMIKGMSIK